MGDEHGTPQPAPRRTARNPQRPRWFFQSRPAGACPVGNADGAGADCPRCCLIRLLAALEIAGRAVTMTVQMAATSSGGSASAAAGYSSAGVLSSLFVSLRPAQWVKNLVLPLPFLFGGALARSSGWALAAEGFAVFCVLSSGVYLINDVKDRERDRAHPVKRNRPLATGLLGVKTAVAAGIALLAGGLLAAFLLDGAFGQLSALYAGLMVLYSLGLKQVPFLEALIVAAGLPLRALAGAALAHVPASPFLVGCAYTLGLFLRVGERQ